MREQVIRTAVKLLIQTEAY